MIFIYYYAPLQLPFDKFSWKRMDLSFVQVHKKESYDLGEGCKECQIHSLVLPSMPM